MCPNFKWASSGGPVGMGAGDGVGNVEFWGKFLENSGKFSENFWNYSGNFPEFSAELKDIQISKIDIVKRQINTGIFTIRLHKNNPEIMLDPSVQYLRKSNFCRIICLFPSPFMLNWTNFTGYL